MIKTRIVKKNDLFVLEFSGKVSFENKASAEVIKSKLEDMKKDDMDYY